MDLVYCSSDSLLPTQQQQRKQELQQPKLIQQQPLMIKKQISHTQQQIQQVQYMNEVKSCNEKSHDNYNDNNNAAPSTQIKQIQVLQIYFFLWAEKKFIFKLLIFFFVKKSLPNQRNEKMSKAFYYLIKH